MTLNMKSDYNPRIATVAVIDPPEIEHQYRIEYQSSITSLHMSDVQQHWCSGSPSASHVSFPQKIRWETLQKFYVVCFILKNPKCCCWLIQWAAVDIRIYFETPKLWKGWEKYVHLSRCGAGVKGDRWATGEQLDDKLTEKKIKRDSLREKRMEEKDGTTETRTSHLN